MPTNASPLPPLLQYQSTYNRISAKKILKLLILFLCLDKISMLANNVLEPLFHFEIREIHEWDFLKYREECPFWTQYCRNGLILLPTWRLSNSQGDG